MYRKLKLVKIDYKYCDYLRKYDYRVPYNNGKKILRPFVGVLFVVSDKEYFAPLSSPKEKHKIIRNTLDIIKIANGSYGIINFNNMIPVMKNNYEIINFDSKQITKRKELLSNQLRELNKERDEIYKKSKLLYELYINNRLAKNVKDRCCNFPLLEEKCKEYNNIEQKV